MSQSAFRAALTDPDRPAPSGLTDPQGRPAGRRFDVYRNNVTHSLTEALRTGFPVLDRLVGRDFFAGMARDFLRCHPPASPVLMLYGQDLPAFLETYSPVAHLPYLPDVARLELALRHAYHAADAIPLPPAALQSLSADRLMAARLRFAPAVQVLRSLWPVHAIWRANTEGTAAPRSVVPEDILVLRPAFDPAPHLLPVGAADFILALIAGQPFAAALDAAPPFDLTAAFGLLIGGGALIGLEKP